MKYLLDTHILLWLIMDIKKISPFILNKLENQNNQLFISKATLWEMAIKISINKLKLPFEFTKITNELKLMNIDIIDIKTKHIFKILELPFHHRDPFDRIIISQSIIEKIPILTYDKVFALYDIETLKQLRK